MRLKSLVGLILCSFFCSYSFASNTYAVDIEIYHKGKLIAEPELNVQDGEVNKSIVSLPGQAAYECTVMVKSLSTNEVDVEIHFSSGQLVFNPELAGIELGKSTSTIFNDFKMELLVK